MQEQTLYFDAAKIDEVKKDFTEQVSRSEVRDRI